MEKAEHFISCDWGTTNFRLRVIQTETLKVLDERTTNQGVRLLNESFKGGDAIVRQRFFGTYLLSQIDLFLKQYQQLPVIVSGMASANIGMRELPYGDLPIAIGGASLNYQDLNLPNEQTLRLISGVKSETGVMRGEETQALGLLKQMKGGEVGTLLLPGTHSKHLAFSHGAFTDFSSYMTGEVFEVLCRESILATSVLPGKWTAATGDRFQAGVLAGYTDGLTPHLFGVRASHILRQTDLTENYYYLSGLVIGDELSHLPKNEHIYLAGSGALFRLYRFGLEVIGGGSNQVTFFQDEALEQALLAGQREFLLR
ncbi:MAG: 2-dehydro-3-deoxygalactonokinase [Bacteroidota bacterium]